MKSFALCLLALLFLGACSDKVDRVSELEGRVGRLDAEAMFELAQFCERGDAKSRGKALGLYRRAAWAGNAEAQYNLGQCFEMAYGAERDVSKAFE